MKELNVRVYKNRKIYIVELRKYTTYLEIANLLRQGHAVKATDIDNHDVTSQVLVKALRALEDNVGTQTDNEVLLSKINKI